MFHKNKQNELSDEMKVKLKQLSCQLSLKEIKQLESLLQDEWQMVHKALKREEYSNKHWSQEELQNRVNRVVNLFAVISFLSKEYFDMEIHLQ